VSNIEWTDTTWNPVVGCTPVSAGCLNCYAATMANRLQQMPQAKDYHPREYSRDEAKDAAREASGGCDSDVPDYRPAVRIAEVRGGRAVFTGDVRLVPERLEEPLSWRKPRMVFVNSMSDLFHEAVPFEFIDRVFAVMALCPQHTFQVLTKRPERMAEYFGQNRLDSAGRHGAVLGAAHFQTTGGSGAQVDWPVPNVWLGTSVENQAAADERIPHLLECPAAVRFLSCEPLLGPVELSGCMTPAREIMGLDGPYIAGPDAGVHWVIVGGESGPNARPCDVAWIRSIVGQCKASGVPVFVKQLGARPVEVNSGPEMPMRWVPDDGGEEVERWYRPSDRKGGDPAEWPEDLRVRQFPKPGAPT